MDLLIDGLHTNKQQTMDFYAVSKFCKKDCLYVIHDFIVEKISPMLKIGGLLLLRAPWRGQLTHLDTAPDDLYQNGGRKYLDENYKEVYRFGVNDISAVYKKIK